MPTDMTPLAQDLAALSEAATQGVWGIWREPIKGKADAVRELIEQVEHTKELNDAIVLLDADGHCPALTGCGPTSDANAAFIVALVNAYRANRLAVIGPDAVERCARAIKASWDEQMQAEADASDGAIEYEPGPWEEWIPEATAAIAALTGRG